MRYIDINIKVGEQFNTDCDRQLIRQENTDNSNLRVFPPVGKITFQHTCYSPFTYQVRNCKILYALKS